MSKEFLVSAELRQDAGKSASRRLRRTGRVPAIVYGGGRDPVQLSLDHAYLVHVDREEAFHSSILELESGDGRRQRVVLRGLHRHPFKPVIYHADFQRVTEDQALRIEVPIHFINQEISPAGKMAGVVISHQLTTVEISALPKDLPEYLAVDLAKLEPGEAVMLSEIPLPAGVSIPALAISDDNDAPVVTALYIRETQGTGALAAEADAALAEAEEVETLAESEEEAEAEAEGEADSGEEGGEKQAKGEKGEAGDEAETRDS